MNDEWEAYQRCINRGTHNERHGSCVECGFEYRDFAEEAAEEERRTPRFTVIEGGNKPYDQETEVVIGFDPGSSGTSFVFFKPGVNLSNPTVSIVHDGTNRCQKGIERIQASGTHVTVWDRPTGLRKLVLAYRSALRRWSRRIWGPDSGAF